MTIAVTLCRTRQTLSVAALAIRTKEPIWNPSYLCGNGAGLPMARRYARKSRSGIPVGHTTRAELARRGEARSQLNQYH